MTNTEVPSTVNRALNPWARWRGVAGGLAVGAGLGLLLSLIHI